MFLLLLALAAGLAHAKKKQNFIFFQPDEMRAEALGCYGNKISRTPNFDRFAREGTLFKEAHVSYTVCSQSRVAFATGWPTHVNGHRTLWSLLHDWEPNLFRYFKQNNYQVHWRGKNDMLAHDSWNSSVTDAYTHGGGCAANNIAGHDTTDPMYYSFLFEPCYQEPGDAKNVNDAIKLINNWNEETDDPFVIFLPLLFPHPPYTSPEPFYSSIPPEDIELRPIGENKPDYHKLIREYRNLTTLTETQLKKLHAVYLGTISYSDHLFGKLLDAVDKNGIRNSTTIAVWADHGDYAGDYGLIEKWPSGLEDVLTRVPLLIRTPGGQKGKVVDNMVQVHDVVSTMLDIADIPLEHVQFGQSLKKILMDPDEFGDPRRAAFAEGGYSTLEPRDLEGYLDPIGYPGEMYYPKSKQQMEHPLSVCRATMIKTKEYKLVFRTDPESYDHDSEFYDLKADPKELKNVYGNPDYQEHITDLKMQLFNWYMMTSDVTPWKRDDRDNSPNGKPKSDKSGDFIYDHLADTAEPIGEVQYFTPSDVTTPSEKC